MRSMFLWAKHGGLVRSFFSCTEMSGSNYRATFSMNTESPTRVEITEPKAFTLEAPYPNPFNSATTIAFTLETQSEVCVRVYNTAGQIVDTLNTGTLPAGEQRMVWNPYGLAGGMYILSIETPYAIHVRKLVFLK